MESTDLSVSDVSAVVDQMIGLAKFCLWLIVPLILLSIAMQFLRRLFAGEYFDDPPKSNYDPMYDPPKRKSKYPIPKQSIRIGKYISRGGEK